MSVLAGASRSSVAVVGSANLDTIITTRRLLDPGETLIGGPVFRMAGGKGLNQASAASRAGVETFFIGVLGADSAGSELRKALRSHGVNTSQIRTVQNTPTGAAFVTVSDDGDNEIIVVPGTNALVDVGVASSVRELSDISVLVTQGEIPETTNEYVANYAHKHGLRYILNLAPVYPCAPKVLALADPLIVNEHEAGQILECSAPSSTSEAHDAAMELAKHSKTVVLTLGRNGSVVLESGRTTHVRSTFVDNVVDTTGAGDAFVGVLSAKLAQGADLVTAAKVASNAAAATVEIQGASASYRVISKD